MLHLENRQLRVDLLDPVADRRHLGPRFCWGGYVWQVHDPVAGPLLTGPEWPSAEPRPHNGQGLPESFRHSTTTGEPLLWDGPFGLSPGIGALGRDSAGAVVVNLPCDWKVEEGAYRIVFRTHQRVGSWNYELARTIELRGRTLLSVSHLANRGTAPLVLEWFAHPFFALTAGRARAALPPGTTLRDNPGYTITDNELSFRRAFDGRDDGHLDHLGLPPDQPLSARLSHPQLTHVDFSTSFAPFKCVVWANGNTLSLEPFLALLLAPGQASEWTLTYDFGERVVA